MFKNNESMGQVWFLWQDFKKNPDEKISLLKGNIQQPVGC